MNYIGFYISFKMGVYLKRSAENDPQSRNYMQLLNISATPNSVPLALVYNNVGYTLVANGLVLFVVSSLGIIAADMQLRPPLFLYVILIMMVILMEVFSCLAVLHRESPLNLQGQREAHKDLLSVMNRDSVRNKAWISSFYLIMVKLDCCGVSGPEDFIDLLPDKYVPMVCCNRKTMAAVLNRKRACTYTAPGPEVTSKDAEATGKGCDDKMAEDLKACFMTSPLSPASRRFHKLKGCYDAIFDEWDRLYPSIIPVGLLILLTQVSSLMIAVTLTHKKIVQCWMDTTL